MFRISGTTDLDVVELVGFEELQGRPLHQFVRLIARIFCTASE